MTLLVLAGTAEARDLVAALAAARAPCVASLAGVTAAPRPLAVETWRGGFGGEAAMTARLRDAGITAVIDATHPFAERISARAARVCAALDLPRLTLRRPPWREPPDTAPPWRRFPTLEAAVTGLPPGARALAATGGRSLPAIERALGGADMAANAAILARVIGPVAGPPPPAGLRLIHARPPFDEAAEIALMRAEAITHLLTRDSGGPARARLDAARTLAIRVHMIARPPPPPGGGVETVAEALDWALRHAGDRAPGRPAQ